MLKKTILAVMVGLLLNLNSFAQNTVQRIYVNLDGFDNAITLPIQNKEGKTLLLIPVADKINTYRLNDSLQVESINMFMNDSKLFSKKKHIGNIINRNKYTLFFYEKSTKNIVRYVLDYDSDDIAKTYIADTIRKEEAFLDAANLNNKVQYITANKRNKTVYVNDIDESGNITKTPFLLDKVNSEDFEIVSDILFANKTDFKKIAYVGNISLNATQSDEKMYAFDNKIIFTCDKSGLGYTYILTLDLITKQSNLRKIEHSALIYDGIGVNNYNSFIFEDKLYQVGASYGTMKVTIKDFQSSALIKEYYADSVSEISFKNGPIMQEGGNSFYSPKSRVLKNSRQLMRKIYYSKVAIAVNRNDDSTFVMTVGSYQEVKNSGVYMPSGGFRVAMPIGPVEDMPINMNVFTNPAYFNYENNKMVKSAYIKSVLSKKDFSHAQSDVIKNTFDKINEFEEKIDNAKSITVFAQNDGFIYGYYNNETKTYNLVRF